MYDVIYKNKNNNNIYIYILLYIHFIVYIYYNMYVFSEQDCATNHFLNRRYSVGWSTKFVLLVLV